MQIVDGNMGSTGTKKRVPVYQYSKYRYTGTKHTGITTRRYSRLKANVRFADEDFVGSQKSHGRRRNFEHTSAPLAQELQEAAARAAEAFAELKPARHGRRR